jgi:hypothetical protein
MSMTNNFFLFHVHISWFVITLFFILNILEPFFRYSVSFPTDDDNVDHLTVDDEN